MPKCTMLVTTDVVGLYPNIPFDLGLQSLSKGLNETGVCKIPTTEFIPLEFNVSLKIFACKYQKYILELILNPLKLLF